MKYLLLFIMIVLAPLTSNAALKVHEWGTFTSVQGSNGEALSGLEYEEEQLPSFVHNRDPQMELTKSLDSLAVCTVCRFSHCCKGECCDNFATLGSNFLRVTQKMETPVLYFYSTTPVEVDVTVDFPKGIISQYYPGPTTFAPKLGKNQSLEGGQIHYSNLKILTGNAPIPAVISGNVYAPARETRSNLVQIQDETEKFIFYRGLGDFKTSLKITSDTKNIVLRDTQARGIPYLLAINIRDGKGAFKELGTLSKNETRSLSLNNFNRDLTPASDLGQFELSIAPKLVSALEKAGLYNDEARAMVNTWRLSYFHTEGLRILYILPRAEVDALLPIQISPKPVELERVLVGRVEVLTSFEEQAMITNFSKTSTSLEGRFKEPKQLRVQELTTGRSL